MKYVIAALIVVLLLASLACAESQAVFNRIDGFTPTPTVTATQDTCIPDCVDLCTQIQEKHSNPPEVCVADCQAVCAEAEAGK